MTLFYNVVLIFTSQTLSLFAVLKTRQHFWSNELLHSGPPPTRGAASTPPFKFAIKNYLNIFSSDELTFSLTVKFLVFPRRTCFKNVFFQLKWGLIRKQANYNFTFHLCSIKCFKRKMKSFLTVTVITGARNLVHP